jgi:hypothetical protein
MGREWTREFVRWAAERPTLGSMRDGWDLAVALEARGVLPRAAGEELAARRAGWRYDGVTAPRARRMPALGRAAGSVALQTAGIVRILRRR